MHPRCVCLVQQALVPLPCRQLLPLPLPLPLASASTSSVECLPLWLFSPQVPDEVAQHLLRQSGYDCKDVRT